MSLISDEFDSKYSQYRLTAVPATVYYIPNFLSKDQCTTLLDKVYSAPKPKWKTLSNRRLQNWGGLPHPKGTHYNYLAHISVYMPRMNYSTVYSGTNC